MGMDVADSLGSAPDTALRSTAGKNSPSTARTQRLKQVFMDEKPTICVERSVLVTESYKATEAEPPVLRQAMAFEKVLDEMPIWIRDDELIVSNLASKPGGSFLFPEYDELLGDAAGEEQVG